MANDQTQKQGGVNMSGYIKDHRKELDSDIWLMPPLYHRTWQWLKYNVNHSDKEIPMRDGTKMLIKRGQRLTSIRDIAKGISWYEGAKYKEPNPKTVSSILDWMIKTNMILINRGQGNREYTLITLINYEIYNERESQGNSKVTPDGEGREQQADINNNDKECLKNDKEIYIAHFEEFWNLYPSKKGKAKAQVKWLILSPNMDFEKVIEGTKAYIKFIEHGKANGKNREYKDGSTYINQESWNDDWNIKTEVSFRPTNKQQPNLQMVPMSDQERKEYRDAYNKQLERNGVSPAVNG